MATVRKRTWEGKGGVQTAWLVDYRDAAGKRRFRTFKRKKDADAALVDIQGELNRGIHTPARDSLTVAEAAEIWYAAGEAKGHERATLRNYRGQLDRYIIPMLGQVKLAKLTTPMVAGFRDELLRKASLLRARKMLGCLKGILADAQERGLVAQNVALSIKIKTKARDERKAQIGIDIPSREEVRLLIDNARARWRPLFVTAVFTGMRASELRGLTWADVDFTKRVIYVRQRADRWGHIGMPKSKAGQREIPSPHVVNTLKEWKLACPKGPANLVFPTGKGTVQLHSNIANIAFYPLQRKAGIVDATGDAKYGLHSVRHFYASHLIDQGFAPKKIQTWLGHSSITITMDRYGHLFDTLDDDHAKLAAGELAIVG